MSIEPHDLFNSVTPDEVAECWEGVSDTLYKALWKVTVGMTPLRKIIDIEESCPSDAIGVNSVSSVWDKFTDDEKYALNVLADENTFIAYDW